MSDVAIRVEGLGKRYRIGERQRYYALRDAVTRMATAPLRALRKGAARDEERHIWALKDVSFEVKRGEVLGVIGRNGAGKSTLLKILSRITEPTAGYAEVRGRVGSLLEVGTGFHPELTGRENIYLNGAILGMKRAEIGRKFDEIVAFSEVENFIDTPVKFYSSGMHMRLAFAVAAHLEPEILVVDEVLAVGDAQFQKKCLNKMRDVGHEGRTVLLVSHNMPAIVGLCDRAILLQSGTIVCDGKPEYVSGLYSRHDVGKRASFEWPSLLDSPGNSTVRLRSVRATSRTNKDLETFDIRDPVTIEMAFDVLIPGTVLSPNFHVYNEDGVCLFITIDNDDRWKNTPRPPGRYISSVTIAGNFFSDGQLLIGAALTTFFPFHVHLFEPDIIGIHIVDRLGGHSSRVDYPGPMPGVIRPMLPWSTTYDALEYEDDRTAGSDCRSGQGQMRTA